jgi:fructoselysine-6-P-deglycase FrlB-like protein
MRFPDGIAAQPAVLARSRETVASGTKALAPLPPGAVVALVGVGASEHAARSAAVQWRAQGLRAVALPAAEALLGSAPADVYVLISESGRSSETIEAVSALGPARTVAVVNAPTSPLAGLCHEVLDLGSGDDSPVYTTGYTATLQALGQLGDAWSGRSTDWAPLADAADRVLAGAPEQLAAFADALDRARLVDVVAGSPSAATAGEGALVLREAARLHTAAHETRDYLHGPMEPLDGQTACVVIGSGREVRLAGDTAALGCPTLLLTTATGVAVSDQLRALVLPVAPTPLAQTVLEILPVQLLAWAVAQTRGLTVEGFRYSQDDTKRDAA